MPISKALGKFAAKVAKQDQSGSVRKLVEEQSVMEKMVRMKKADLEDVAETGSSSEKYYAKQELKRRSQGVKAPVQTADEILFKKKLIAILLVQETNDLLVLTMMNLNLSNNVPENPTKTTLSVGLNLWESIKLMKKDFVKAVWLKKHLPKK